MPLARRPRRTTTISSSSRWGKATASNYTSTSSKANLPHCGKDVSALAFISRLHVFLTPWTSTSSSTMSLGWAMSCHEFNFTSAGGSNEDFIQPYREARWHRRKDKSLRTKPPPHAQDRNHEATCLQETGAPIFLLNSLWTYKPMEQHFTVLRALGLSISKVFNTIKD